MKYYTAAALGRTLGLSEDTVKGMVRSGVIQRGKAENGFLLLEPSAREIIAELSRTDRDDKPMSYEDERARLMRAKRQSAEYDLGLRKKELHTSEDIELTVTAVLMRFRSKLRALPARLAPQCALTSDKQGVYELLKRATDETLEELSDLEGLLTEEGESADAIEQPIEQSIEH